MTKFPVLLILVLVVVIFVTATSSNGQGDGKKKNNPIHGKKHPQNRKHVQQNGRGKTQRKHPNTGGSQKKKKTPPKAPNKVISPQNAHVNAAPKGNKVIKKRLRGVNRSGSEFACIGGYDFFDGPTDDKSIEAMKGWNINVVRIPLNADCWLGVNNHKPEYTGANYKKAIIDYVHRLRKHDLSVIMDLHWTNGLFTGAGCECHEKAAKCQKPMPDREYAIPFWKELAKEFGKDENIIFDLFNEPYPNMVYWDKKQCWNCWKNGGKEACKLFPYEVAGMQDLVNAIRSEKAINPLMVAGPDWAGDLKMWKEHVPNDPLKKIVAAWHNYAAGPCNNTKCWEETVGPVAQDYSVIVGELGETDCGHTYVDAMIDWLDKYDISYLAWTWNTWKCEVGPSVISNYDGTPTKFGEGFKNRFTKKN